MDWMCRTAARRAAVTAAAAALLATPAAAQVANPLPPALGLGENYTAAARGYAAVAWNPAALGLPDGPESSALIGAFRGLSGLGPVTVGDLGRWQDRVVPLEVRERWLSDIRRDGGQRGTAGADVAWAAFQVGRVAAQVSSSGRALNDIGPGLAELILMGNADETGAPADIDLAGSLVDASAYTTVALSYGMPLPVAGPARIAAGLTVKYTIGHALAVSQESAGQATADPTGVSFRFPIVYTPVVHDDLGQYWLSSGSGVGLDLAVAAEIGRLTVAAVLGNVVNGFAWDPAKLRYRPLELVFNDDELDSDVEWRPFSEAPAELRALVDDATFRPWFSAGAALAHSPQLRFTADARIGGSTGLHTRAPVHAGAGVEYRPRPWLPLQAGAAYVRFGEDRAGVQLTGGAGALLGSFHLSAAGGVRTTGMGRETMFMISLLSHTF